MPVLCYKSESQFCLKSEGGPYQPKKYENLRDYKNAPPISLHHPSTPLLEVKISAFDRYGKCSSVTCFEKHFIDATLTCKVKYVFAALQHRCVEICQRRNGSSQEGALSQNSPSVPGLRIWGRTEERVSLQRVAK